MYKSPIELLVEEFDKKIVKKQDADIYQAVLNCGVNVDKDELIRALEYDRAQYEKGFHDGVQSVQGWIPVSEMLPEPCENVLCWYEYFRFGDYNRMFQTYGIGYYFRDGFWGGEVSNGQQTKVLAWMPLPEPPKEDER